MKIVYQLIGAAGEFEDYQEWGCGAWFDKEKALAKKADMEDRENLLKRQAQHCLHCPFTIECSSLEDQNRNKKLLAGYCPFSQETTWDDDCGGCCDYMLSDEDVIYYIKTLEVEE